MVYVFSFHFDISYLLTLLEAWIASTFSECYTHNFLNMYKVSLSLIWTKGTLSSRAFILIKLVILEAMATLWSRKLEEKRGLAQIAWWSCLRRSNEIKCFLTTKNQGTFQIFAKSFTRDSFPSCCSKLLITAVSF